MSKVRKAILTGGGRATRLRPITTTINKHLIPLANKPMIFHAIEKVKEVGVEEIFININPGETELQKYVGDGGHWGLKIHFFEQDGGPQGIAHAVKCAEKFIGNEPFVFYLSDNVILGSLKPMFDHYNEFKPDCMLALSEVSDPQRFGVPIFNNKKELVDIVEKPSNPQNNFAVTGIYIYGPEVFFQAFDKIQKSPRGEYEISDIHSNLLKNGFTVQYKEITGWWKDTGKPDDLIIANRLLLDELPSSDFKIEADLGKAIISGNVQIGAGTRIGDNVKIIGPAIIGANCVLENCIINAHTTIGSGSVIKNAEIGDSIVFGNCFIESKIKISRSIIGERVTLVKNGQEDGHRLIVGDNTYMEL